MVDGGLEIGGAAVGAGDDAGVLGLAGVWADMCGDVPEAMGPSLRAVGVVSAWDSAVMRPGAGWSTGRGMAGTAASLRKREGSL